MTAGSGKAFVVPDVATWVMNGHDPLADGLVRAVAPEQASVLLVPRRIPAELSYAVRDVWEQLLPPRRYVAAGDPTPGENVAELLRNGDGATAHAYSEHHDHGAHAEHDEHGGGHDHHDMMAIVGEPSEDGLIMEPIEFALGPLFASLPGGLLVELTLDGDVVARARARATLRLSGEDPLAPLSSRVAVARARRPPSEALARRQIAAVEVERALSHAVALEALGFVLGWRELTDASGELSRSLLRARAAAEARLEPQADEPSSGDLVRSLQPSDHRLAAVGRLLHRRAAAARLRGRAAVDHHAVAAHQVGGPIGRAAGVVGDARTDDPLYEALDFVPEGADAGDAEARSRLRVAEISASLALALRAVAEEGSDGEAASSEPGRPVVVEGPRGPLHTVAGPVGEVVVATAGADAALDLAGDAIVGLEFGAAMAGLVSFDLSPWRVDA